MKTIKIPLPCSIIDVMVIDIFHLLSFRTIYLGGFERNLAAVMKRALQLQLNLEQPADQCFLSLPELCFLSEM
jgi:hypothetical protein